MLPFPFNPNKNETIEQKICRKRAMATKDTNPKNIE